VIDFAQFIAHALALKQRQILYFCSSVSALFFPHPEVPASWDFLMPTHLPRMSFAPVIQLPVSQMQQQMGLLHEF
jgi:hypothetical protein